MVLSAWTRVIAILIALSCPVVASAAPVTYQFASGAATLTLTAGTTEIGRASLAMDGRYVTFDDAVPSLVDFRFTSAASGAIVLTNSYGGYDEIQVLSSALSPALGYAQLAASDLGGGNFFVAVGPVESSGIFSARDSSGSHPDLIAQTFSFTNSSPLVANLSLANGTLELTGITLAVLPPAFGELEALVIKADLSWSGAQPIPEPGSVAMALAGAAVVALALRPARR